jgi:putative methyltransferase (TIGR04325 family)
VVVQAVLTAAREVRAGRGAYERDGVVFDEIQYYWPTLAGIMLAAAKFRGEPHLVDFGGSLGTAYFQNKKFLDRLPGVSWTVVEQQGFVSIGAREFATDGLDFATSLDEAASRRPIDVVLCSAVLQYVEASHELLGQFAETSAQFLVLDRVLMHDGDSDLLTLQMVPDWIYEASYPCWVFSRRELLARLDTSWVIIEEIPALETRALTDSGRFIYWTGFVLQRRAD